MCMFHIPLVFVFNRQKKKLLKLNKGVYFKRRNTKRSRAKAHICFEYLHWFESTWDNSFLITFLKSKLCTVAEPKSRHRRVLLNHNLEE